MSGKWSAEDLAAIEQAMEMGIITIPKHEVGYLPLDSLAEPFEPMSFPAELRQWSSTRMGDIEVKFIIPSQWVGSLVMIQTAMRRRLVVSLQEYDDDLTSSIIDVQ